MSQIRSVYMNDEEVEALRRFAEERNMALSSVVRIALRLMLDLPVPSWARQLSAEGQRLVEK